MRDVYFALIIAPLLLASQCLGQEPGPDYEHLKALEWMIGDWDGTWKVQPDSGLASVYPVGKTVHSFNSYSWMQNKNYIGLRFRDTIDGKTIHEGFEIIRRDPEAKNTAHWLLSVAGGSGVGEWSKQANTWKLDWSYKSGTGMTLEGVALLTPIDKDTHTWQLTEMKQNGKNVTDTPVVTYRRRQTSSAADFKAFLAAWQGRWRSEVPGAGEEKVESQADCKVATDGKSMIAHTRAGDLTGLWFVTYDAHNRRIISQWSQSDGEIGRSELKMVGDTWVITGEGATADGKEVAVVHEIAISDNGNTHVWSSKRTVDGETKSTRTEWKRVDSQE